MITETRARYEKTFSSLGVEAFSVKKTLGNILDMEQIKDKAGITLPPMTGSFSYSRRIRTEAVMRLGAYNVAHRIKKWLKINEQDETRSREKALEVSVAKMKNQMEESLKLLFTDFRENLKFQYLFALMDQAALALQEGLTDRFRVFTDGMVATRDMLGADEQAKQEAKEALKELEIVCKEIAGELAGQ